MVTLVLHELGHVMGLGHSSAADQLMFHESSSSTRPMLEAGDLAGLQKLYEYPCF
jgi:predicted Zn-dependent protease